MIIFIKNIQSGILECLAISSDEVFTTDVANKYCVAATELFSNPKTTFLDPAQIGRFCGRSPND